MLERALTHDEVGLARRAERFIRKSHRDEGGHDHAHVLAVTDYAIRIAEGTEAPADPLVVVLGALFHDLGRIGSVDGRMHGLLGAALTREWLHSTDIDGPTRERILRVVARHTPTTGVPPEAVEERIVFDADALDRLGIVGMLRGLVGKRGSTEYIIEDRIQKRLGDYDRLHFDVSRRMGEALHAETLEVVGLFRSALEEEARQLERIEWPAAGGVRVPVPSLRAAAASGKAGSLTRAMARVEREAAPEPAPRRDDGAATPPRPRSQMRMLSAREAALVERVAEFARVKHADGAAHDYAHVLSVVKNALRIAASVPEPADPLVLVCGALLHDVGWVHAAGNGRQHGLRGASVANELLASTWMDEEVRARIRRVIVRHSLESGQTPRAVEERIVWDADGLAGVGLIGVARGIISGVGSMGEIVRACLRYAGKRAEHLHFDESRRIAERLRGDTRNVVRRFLSALQQRKMRVERLRLPD